MNMNTDKYNCICCREINELKQKLDTVSSPLGLEIHMFKIGWYNDHVAENFRLPYSYDTIAALVISAPKMFDLALKPFLVSQHEHGIRDLIDECMIYHFGRLKQLFPEEDIEELHDFEMQPNRRPKILVQTAAHEAGAAYYYQRTDVSDQPWPSKQKIFGVCIHPKYGGWFSMRGVLIFKNVQCPDLKKMPPTDVVPSREGRIDLLEKFMYHWRDGSYRDIIDVEDSYSEEQRLYFDTLPKNRLPLIEHMRQNFEQQSTSAHSVPS